MKFVVGNWKMNPKSLPLAKKLFENLRKKIKKRKDFKIIICPPFIFLPKILEIKSKIFEIGAQNCFWKNEGPFTGEISPLMLKNLKIKYVILGHSERRKYLKEDDEMIAKKIKSALKVKLVPILCIGETKEEREKEIFTKVLKSQLERSLKEIQELKNINFILAYEPVWAIGTGNYCEPRAAREMLIYIKKILSKYLKDWKKIKILYGGSVDSKNVSSYIKVGFDGVLVGGASLRVSEFKKIIESLCSI